MVRTRLFPGLLAAAALVLAAAAAAPSWAKTGLASDGKGGGRGGAPKATPRTAPRTATGAIEIVDFGIYSTRHVRMEKAPGHISGEREVVRGVRLVRKTRKFAAQMGRTFGYRYRLLDPSLDGKVLTFRLIFPRLTNPKTGRSLTYQDMRQRVRLGAVGFEGYGFDHRWEIGEGVWTMQIIHNGTIIAEQKFHVLVPLN